MILVKHVNGSTDFKVTCSSGSSGASFPMDVLRLNCCVDSVMLIKITLMKYFWGFYRTTYFIKLFRI